MENAHTEKAAAHILLITFEIAQEQKIVEHKGHCILATLIRLTLATANQLIDGQSKHSHPTLSLLHQNPFLHQLFFKGKAIRELCDEFGLTSQELGKMIRAELNAVREANKEAVHR